MDQNIYLIIAIILGIVVVAYAFYLFFKGNKLTTNSEKTKSLTEDTTSKTAAFFSYEYLILAIFVIVIFLTLMFVTKLTIAISFVFGALLITFLDYCHKSLFNYDNQSKSIALSSKTIINILIMGLGLFGIAVTFLIFNDITILVGFIFGVSLIALLLHISDRVYNKLSADIQTNLPLNYAIVFETAIVLLGVAIIFGANVNFNQYTNMMASGGIVFPIVFVAICLIANIVGILFLHSKKDNLTNKLLLTTTALTTLFIVIITAVFSYLFFKSFNPLWAIIVGIVFGFLIGKLSELYLNHQNKDTNNYSLTNGLASSMISIVIPIILIAIAIILAYIFSEMYGIILSALAMFFIASIMVSAINNYHENLPEKPIDQEKLTINENINKGFTIGSTVLVIIALFLSFAIVTNISTSNISFMDPSLLVGLLLGAMLPFIFVSWGLKDIKQEDDILKVSQFNNTIMVGVLVVILPTLIGFVIGRSGLVGLLVGVLSVGIIMITFMINSTSALQKTTINNEVNNAATIVVPIVSILVKLLIVGSIIFAATIGTGLFK